MYTDAGKELIWTLVMGGAGDALNSANSFLGVGDDSTSTDGSMTDLQAPTNKQYFPMDPGFPQIDGTDLLFQATVPAPDALFVWNEIAVFNGDPGASTPVMVNRKVEDHGEKGSSDPRPLRFRLPIKEAIV